MPQFNRSASVRIGPEGEEGIRISNLRIKFQIKKTLEDTTTNTCTISIFNLSQTTREKINKEDVAILSAGYLDGDGEKDIFIGTIKRVTHLHQRPNIETKIECYDGERILNGTRVSLSYGSGSPATEIMADIADLMGMNLGLPSGITDSPLMNGFSFIGKGSDAISKMTERLGLEWSAQDDQIQVLETGRTNDREEILLKPTTGLVGSPERIQDEGSTENLNNVEAPDGWKIPALLQPEIIPGDTVSIKSKEVNGSFRVEALEHSGDTHGQDWRTNLEIKDEE